MKKNLRFWVVAAVGAVASMAFTSCAYDPYYSSVGGSYSSGYGGGYGGSYGGGFGDGYGYGNSSFNTSVFVSTGSPRWGYDPYSYCYYDYNRRAYYDPYLYGYYPVGYRPPVVYGVPHPHGWRPGRGYISPPSRVSYGTVSNYRNRESAYRNTDYGWAKQVRQQPVEQGRVQGTRSGRTSQYQRPETGYRSSSGSASPSRQSAPRTSSRQEVRPSTRQQSQSRYNSPVTTSRAPASSAQRPQLGVPRESRSQATRESSQPRMQSQARGQSQSRPQPQGRSQSEPRSQGGGNRESKAQEDKRIRGYR